MRLEKKRKLGAAKRLELRNKNAEASMVDPEVDQRMKEEMLNQLTFFKDNILKGIIGGIVTETKRSGPVFEKHLEQNSDLIKEMIEGIKEGMDQEIKDLIESNTDAVREAIESFTTEVSGRLQQKGEKTKSIDKALLDVFKQNTEETQKTTINTAQLSEILESIKESTGQTTNIVSILESIKESSTEESSKFTEQVSTLLESIKESGSVDTKQVSKLLESINESNTKVSSDVKNEVQFRTETERLTAEIIKILESTSDKTIDSKKLLESLKISTEKIVKTSKESLDLEKEKKESKEEKEEEPESRPTSRKRGESDEGLSTEDKVGKILRSREAEATEAPELTGKQKRGRFLKRIVFGDDLADQMESRENKKLQYIQAQKQLRPEMSEKDLAKEYKNIEQQKEELARADRKYQQLKESGHYTPEELEKTDIAKERKMYADFIMPDRDEESKAPREERARQPSREKPLDLFKASSEEKAVEDERARTQTLSEETEQGDALTGLLEESKKHTEILTGMKELLAKGGAAGGGGEGEGSGLIDAGSGLAGKAKSVLKKGASAASTGLKALAGSAKFMKFAKVGGAALALGAGAYTAYKGYGEASEESDTKLADIDRAERQGAITKEEAAQQREATKAETTEKKSSAVGKGAGMAAGALGGAKIGAMIGTAFGGPVGTLVGGAIGGGIGMLAGTKLGESAGRVVGKGISGLKSMLGLYKDEKPTVESTPQEASKEQTALKESTDIKFSEASFREADPENYKKFAEFRDKRVEELTKKYMKGAKSVDQENEAAEDARIEGQAEAIKKFRKEIEAAGAGVKVKDEGKTPQEASKEQTALKESTDIKFSEPDFAKNDPENYKKFKEFRDSRVKELSEKYKEESKTSIEKSSAVTRARMVAQAEAIKKFRKEIEAAGAGVKVKDEGKTPLKKTGSGEFTPEKQAKEEASEAVETPPKEEKKSFLSSLLPESKLGKAAVLATGPIGLAAYGAYKAGSWLKNKIVGGKDESPTIESAEEQPTSKVEAPKSERAKQFAELTSKEQGVDEKLAKLKEKYGDPIVDIEGGINKYRDPEANKEYQKLLAERSDVRGKQFDVTREEIASRGIKDTSPREDDRLNWKGVDEKRTPTAFKNAEIMKNDLIKNGVAEKDIPDVSVRGGYDKLAEMHTKSVESELQKSGKEQADSKQAIKKQPDGTFTPEKTSDGKLGKKVGLMDSLLPESKLGKAAVLATGPIGLAAYGAYKAGSWIKNKLFGDKEEGATVTSSAEKTEEKPSKAEKSAAWSNAIRSEKEIIKDAGYNPEWKKAYFEALETVTPRSDNPQSIQGAIKKAQVIASTKADQYGTGLKEAKSTTSSETLAKQPDGTFTPKADGEKPKKSAMANKAEQVRAEASKLGLDPNKATGVFKGGVLTGIEDESGKKYDVQVREEDRKKVETANMVKQMNERSALLEQQAIKDAKTEAPVSGSIAKAPVDQTSVAAAKAAAKNISIKAPAPVVISQPAPQQQVVSEPFTNSVRNSENSISRYIGSRYVAY